MKTLRSFIAGAGVGLCLCAIARADDDQIPNARNSAGPVAVKRVIVVRSLGGQVIYVRPSYQLHSTLPMNRSWYPFTAGQSHRRSLETSGSADNYNHVAKTLKTGHNVDTNQSEHQANKDDKSADHKAVAKQTEAKPGDKAQHQTNQPEDAGSWDRLTVQAQKEEAALTAEPGGIEPKAK
jgi:hypothetical protein